jgi:hypothetical protein
VPPADVAPPVSTRGVPVPAPVLVAAGFLGARFALAARLAVAVRLAAAGFAAAFRLRGVAARGLGRFVADYAAASVDEPADGFAPALAFAVLFARRFDDAGAVLGVDEAVRRAAGFFAAARGAALREVAAAGCSAWPDDDRRSRSDTRRASCSISERRPRSSATTRSSRTSRMRFAAPATSPTNSCARSRVDPEANVRSTAERTASTASTAPALSCFPLFLSFLSFFGIAERS